MEPLVHQISYMKHFLPLIFLILLPCLSASAQNSNRYIFLEAPGLNSARVGNELHELFTPIAAIKSINFCDELHLVALEINGEPSGLSSEIIQRLKIAQHRYILKSEQNFQALSKQYVFKTITHQNSH